LTFTSPGLHFPRSQVPFAQGIEPFFFIDALALVGEVEEEKPVLHEVEV
jgi:hypothetical protein